MKKSNGALSSLIRTILFACVIGLSAGQSAMAREIVLQDSKLIVAFNSETGALTRLVSKEPQWAIERRPDLGISFRMLVPLPDRQDNFVLGQKQRAVKVEKVSGHEVVIEWKNLLSQHGGVLPITFTATVKLNDGVLTFGGKVVNDSKLTIQTLDYPYFGDFNPPSRKSYVSVRTAWYDNLQSAQIYPDFINAKGYWGDFYPTKTFDSYRSLFCLIQARTKGVYVEMENPNQPYLIQYTFEQHPGLISEINNAVPQTDYIAGKSLDGKTTPHGVPVHLEFRTCHFIFEHPNSTFELAPVVVRCYSGDWHAGVDLYKEWRKAWYKEPHQPAWLNKVSAWQQLQIDSPVQDWRVPYDSLVSYGKECAENGVDAIQLVGWNTGGQDGHDPEMSTDPHLGTTQQLREAIKKIQAMGVHVILFGKLNWADMTTEWTKTALYKYAATDPYGIPYQQGGYSYYTPVQLAGINNHRRYVMDFLDPSYREIAVGQFDKLLSLGASGWLYDEVCHHGPVKYSFASGHGYNPPGFIYAGDMPMGRDLRAAADSISGRNFLFAGEGPQDWLTQYYPFTYTRITAGSTPVQRYIAPHAPIMVAVTGFNDRDMLNLCLLDRYIIEYEPYYFKGHLTDFPLTLAYGKEIDALRTKYKAYLWDATFRDTMGANVKADGSYKYSVFVTSTGKRALVVVNLENSKPITARVDIPHHGKLVVATPGHPDAVPTSGTLRIPPQSAVVVMEK